MDEPRQTGPEKEGPPFHGMVRGLVVSGLVVLVTAVALVRTHAIHAAHRPLAAATQGADTQARAAPVIPGLHLADFRGEDPSPDTRLMANWVVATGNARKHAFVIVDKKDARVSVFGPDGKLVQDAPALLGAWHGDDPAPGIGDKPLSQIKEDEKITPAGRFVAERGENLTHENIVWIDYDLGISMHRIRPEVESEHRLERLASQTTDDNRISFGCVNLPVTFFEDVLDPEVKKYGAVVYVLPEVKSLQQVFGAYDVVAAAQEAAARPATPAPSVQTVALAR